MEIKLQCNCGQKYKFDVQPVNGSMPFTVNCPICGIDGTPTANSYLAQVLAPQSAPAVAPAAPMTAAPATPAAPKIRINRPDAAAPPVPPPVAPTPAAPPASPAAVPPPLKPSAPQPPAPRAPVAPLAGAVLTRASGGNLMLGILGAFLGAAVGSGLMYGYYYLTSSRFWIMGTVVGVLTGLGARLFYKVGSSTLGGIASALAMMATAGTLYLMYGELPMRYILSVILSAFIAYRIVSR